MSSPPSRSPSICSADTGSAIDPSDIPPLRTPALDGKGQKPVEDNPTAVGSADHDGWSDTGTAIPFDAATHDPAHAHAHSATAHNNSSQAAQPIAHSPTHAPPHPQEPASAEAHHSSKDALIVTTLTLLAPDGKVAAVEIVTFPSSATLASLLALAGEVLMKYPLAHEGGNVDPGERERAVGEGWLAASLALALDGGTAGRSVAGKLEGGKEGGKIGGEKGEKAVKAVGAWERGRKEGVAGKIGFGMGREVKKNGQATKREGGKEGGRVVRVHEGNFGAVLMMLAGGRGELVIEFSTKEEE